MKKIYVWSRREEIHPQLIEESTVVVMDVFLATTTLVTIVENGARTVYPCESVVEAERLARDLKPGSYLTGGEQDGLQIDGFDCGPYPQEYSLDEVTDKDVLFVSTNGTRAIRQAQGAKHLFISSLRNAKATARFLQEQDPEILYFACAGSKGDISLEDMVCAGYMLSFLDTGDCALNDAAILAKELLLSRDKTPFEWLREGRVGRWFLKHRQESVVEFTAETEASSAVIKVEGGKLKLV